MKISNFNEFINKNVLHESLTIDILDKIQKHKYTIKRTVFITLGLGAIILILKDLISSARKRYKIDTLLKNETDPIKRERLKEEFYALSQRELDLKFKIKRMQERQQNKLSKIKDNEQQATVKQLANLEKERGRLEALKIQYNELISEISYHAKN